MLRWSGRGHAHDPVEGGADGGDAYCRLAALAAENHVLGCEINHVVAGKTADGSTLRVVFVAADFSASYAGPGLARGPFTIVDDDGHFVKPFANANVLDDDSDVVSFDHGRTALVQVFPYGAGVLRSTTVLHFVPLEKEQKANLKVVDDHRDRQPRRQPRHRRDR